MLYGIHFSDGSDKINFSGTYESSIKKFLKENIELLKTNDIEKLYKISAVELGAPDSSDLTLYFLKHNIDFLKYVEEIPEDCFSHLIVDKIIIPNHIKSLGAYSFQDTDLKEITIPGNVKIIGESAFDGCNGLQKIIIEEGVEKIEDHAFRYCNGLEIINFPNSIKDIGQNIFQGNGIGNFTVICDEGSYAYEWCENNGGIDIDITTN